MVGSVADEGVGALFMEATSSKTVKVLEAYELTNLKRFLDPFPRISEEKSMEKLKSEEFRERRASARSRERRKRSSYNT